MTTIAPRPNIVFIHCHDLGTYLHAYGVQSVHSSNLDRLAHEGVLFEHSFCTAPQCSPSRASLFTGRYPHNNGVMGLTHSNFAWDLNPDETHLAAYLREAGYSTTCIGTVHEGRQTPQSWGYDSYLPAHWGDEVADTATAHLAALDDAQTDAPFYLYVGFIEPHRLPVQGELPGDHTFLHPTAGYGPDASRGVEVPGYLKDTPGTRQELAELQGMVRWVDGQIGRILDAVYAASFNTNTLIIFTTDHGYAMPRAKCNLYDPGIAVALILRYPDRAGWTGGRRIQAMISNIDIVPTLLDLLDVPIPDKIQGVSLLRALDGEDCTPRRTYFGELTYHGYYDPKRCVRTERYKLIANFSTAPAFMDPSQSWRPRSDTVVPENHATAFHPSLELYDLSTDPWELNNLAVDEAWAEVRQAMMRSLYRHMVLTEDPLLNGAVTSPQHTLTQSLLHNSLET